MQVHLHTWNGLTVAGTVMASACTPSKACKEIAPFFTETEGDKREIKPKQVYGHINLPLVLKIACSLQLCLDSVYIHKQGVTPSDRKHRLGGKEWANSGRYH